MIALRVEPERWRRPLFTLFQTTASTTGSCAANIGNECGHYATREATELAAQAIARELETKLVIHLPDGRRRCESFTKGWLARLLGR